MVGDFAGPKALRSVARYLYLRHATVSVFYTSNVEQYLFRPAYPGGATDAWQRFYDNVAALPTDTRSTFIRAVFNQQGPLVFRAPPQPDPQQQSGVIPIPPPTRTLYPTIRLCSTIARKPRSCV